MKAKTKMSGNVDELNIQSKLNNGVNFTLEEILNVKLDKTVEEFCDYKCFASRNKNGIFNKLYPNSYLYAFEDGDKTINEFSHDVYRLVFNINNPITKKLIYKRIETVKDYINFTREVLKDCHKVLNWETIVKTILSSRSLENDGYLTLRSLYPSMEWEEEYIKLTENKVSDHIYSEEAKEIFKEYFKKNIIFRAIMLSDTMGIGKFYGMDSDYFLYLLQNRIPECLNMSYEDMENYLNTLSKTWDINFIKIELNKFKVKKYKELSQEDFNHVINYIDEYLSKKDNSGYMYFDPDSIFINALKKKYPNNNMWFKHFDKNIAMRLVESEAYSNISKDIVRLMDNNYKMRWQRVTGKTLTGVNISPLNWNGSIVCSVTKVTSQHS